MIPLLLALEIVLVPFDVYLGEIPQIDICFFSYGPGTILTPGTKLNIEPYVETYGPDSVVNGGVTCNACKVSNIIMIDTGVTTIYCD